MRNQIFQLSALLASLAILGIGNGLQGTLIGLRAGVEGIETDTLGIIMSAYFIGYISGSIYIPRLVESVGHIRTFAAMASVISAIALLYILVISPTMWFLFRLANGFCYAGLVLVAESWISSHSDKQNRGFILSIYSFIVMAAWATGQLLLNIAPPKGFELFLLVSILLSLSLVPVTLSRVSRPGDVSATRMKFKRLFQLSPTGFIGTFIAGIVFNGFIALGPRYGQELSLSTTQISHFMFMVMLAGALFQPMLGWLSDRIDRRKVIFTSSSIAAVCSLILATQLIPINKFSIYSLIFLFGGFLIPIYVVCIAHINDHAKDHERIAITGGMILIYGVGSALGPIVAGFFMEFLGSNGLFWFTGSILSLFSMLALFRYFQRPPVDEDEKDSFVALPRTTHVIANLEEATDLNSNQKN